MMITETFRCRYKSIGLDFRALVILRHWAEMYLIQGTVKLQETGIADENVTQSALHVLRGRLG